MGKNSRTLELKRLSELRKSGVITGAEFRKEKYRILYGDFTRGRGGCLKPILIALGVFFVYSYMSDNKSENVSAGNNVAQTQPTNSECRQIFKDGVYHELMTSICYNDVVVEGFYSNLMPSDFVTYQKNIGCPMADADVAKKDTDITSLAVAKGLKKYPNKEAFCKAELDYFSKIIKKYNEID